MTHSYKLVEVIGETYTTWVKIYDDGEYDYGFLTGIGEPFKGTQVRVSSESHISKEYKPVQSWIYPATSEILKNTASEITTLKITKTS